jgi:hypothetical protein
LTCFKLNDFKQRSKSIEEQFGQGFNLVGGCWIGAQSSWICCVKAENVEKLIALNAVLFI